jgi:ribosomal-protein-alanine N-acetyltransferase
MTTRRAGKTTHPDFPELETERLLLRKIVPGDAPALFAIFSDDKVTRYYDLGTMTHLSQAETMVRRMEKRYKHGQALRWGIVRKEDGAFLGTCGYHLQAVEFKAEIGYELGRPFWHQGYMREALRAMLAYGFEAMHLNRIEALVMPGNEPSARVLRKLGFREEGLLREFVFFKGRFYDMRFFALLRSEADDTLRVANPKDLTPEGS